MIVEGVFALATVSVLLVEPIKTLLLANTTLDAVLDRPSAKKLEHEGREAEAFLDDFLSEEGKPHTEFMIAKTDEGLWCLFSKAEIELKKQVSFIESALKKGLPVGPQALQKICSHVRERDKEVARAKSRQVKMRAKELSKAAQKANKRLARAA
jgi:hypothetical protein